MKKILFCFMLILFSSVVFAEEDLTILLDKAKTAYINNNLEESKKFVKEYYDKISIIISNSGKEDFEEVDFTRLKTFTSKYENKKIKLSNISISLANPLKTADGKYYRISVNTLNQYDSFFNLEGKENSLIFIVSETLLEKLMDEIPAGYVGYYNIYTDIIYHTTDKDSIGLKTDYYFARIIKLEAITYNNSSGTTKLSGKIITE